MLWDKIWLDIINFKVFLANSVCIVLCLSYCFCFINWLYFPAGYFLLFNKTVDLINIFLLSVNISYDLFGDPGIFDVLKFFFLHYRALVSLELTILYLEAGPSKYSIQFPMGHKSLHGVW